MKLVIRKGRKDVFRLQLDDSFEKIFDRLREDFMSEKTNLKQYTLKILSTILRRVAE